MVIDDYTWNHLWVSSNMASRETHELNGDVALGKSLNDMRASSSKPRLIAGRRVVKTFKKTKDGLEFTP